MNTIPAILNRTADALVNKDVAELDRIGADVDAMLLSAETREGLKNIIIAARMTAGLLA